jgi:hypothetical protein
MDDISPDEWLWFSLRACKHCKRDIMLMEKFANFYELPQDRGIRIYVDAKMSAKFWEHVRVALDELKLPKAAFWDDVKASKSRREPDLKTPVSQVLERLHFTASCNDYRKPALSMGGGGRVHTPGSGQTKKDDADNRDKHH